MGVFAITGSLRDGDRALMWLCQTLAALDAEVPKEASSPISIVLDEISVARLKDKEVRRKDFSSFPGRLKQPSDNQDGFRLFRVELLTFIQRSFVCARGSQQRSL